jgi:rubrerythrin
VSAGYLRKCAGKKRHKTSEEAEQHRRSMVRAGHWTMGKSSTYRCNQCGTYHAGHIGTRNRGKGRGKRR